ncbi:ATP-binding cassette domain-containing protein [Anaerococcus sp. Marseille-P9784]|uniref:ATP-binding cassette domain-containing protein n=1 Tax=Anaerococcus sp. Marseille-P9784 TaxID=2614127 RepID=UPI00124A928F|nr:ABC transporter ATP-binding protein [Anaerococcus sp. Marseille-P9784]
MDKIIELQNVKKKYKEITALDDISFDICQGKILGLFGPSGSGKTSLLKIIGGLSKATKGEVKIFGEDISYKNKEFIAFKSSTFDFEEDFTGNDLIELYGDFYKNFDKDYNERLNEYLDIDTSKFIKNLSKGQRQKLNIALTLSLDAKIYLLDEIIDGLDQVASGKIIDLLIDKIDGKKTMIIASHKIDKIEDLIDDVIFLNRGKIFIKAKAEDLRNKENLSLADFYDRIYLN